jgi:hypothetical protein
VNPSGTLDRSEAENLSPPRKKPLSSAGSGLYRTSSRVIGPRTPSGAASSTLSSVRWWLPSIKSVRAKDRSYGAGFEDSFTLRFLVAPPAYGLGTHCQRHSLPPPFGSVPSGTFHKREERPEHNNIRVFTALDKHNDNSNRGGFCHIIRASARQSRR